MQLTIRFILRNSFCLQDGELTKQMSRLYNKCPTVFDNVLPRTDKRDMLLEDEKDFEMDIRDGADANHRRTTVIGQIPPSSVCGTTHFINEDQPLPTKHASMSTRFKWALRRAYMEEYGKDEIYQFGNKRIQWSNKLGFTDRQVLPFPIFPLI